MVDTAKMLRLRLTNILTYFKHPITIATSESMNAKIQWVKYTARGFRNFDNFARDLTSLPKLGPAFQLLHSSFIAEKWASNYSASAR